MKKKKKEEKVAEFQSAHLNNKYRGFRKVSSASPPISAKEEPAL